MGGNESQPFEQWYWACMYGKLDLVKLLINHYDYTSCRAPGIKLEKTDDSSEAGLISVPREHLWNAYVTPLHVASFYGHLNIVNFLVSDAKCDLNCENLQGFTPLHMACHEGHLQIVNYLLATNVIHIGICSMKDPICYSLSDGTFTYC